MYSEGTFIGALEFTKLKRSEPNAFQIVKASYPVNNVMIKYLHTPAINIAYCFIYINYLYSICVVNKLPFTRAHKFAVAPFR